VDAPPTQSGSSCCCQKQRHPFLGGVPAFADAGLVTGHCTKHNFVEVQTAVILTNPKGRCRFLIGLPVGRLLHAVPPDILLPRPHISTKRRLSYSASGAEAHRSRRSCRRHLAGPRDGPREVDADLRKLTPTRLRVADGVAFRCPDEQSSCRCGPAVFLSGPCEHP
jgi:hypothetical protein